MAESYPKRRFPSGPKIQPGGGSALRGPKRTGPIGALIPGDDIEVAREIERLKQRKPVRRVRTIADYEIKLVKDGSTVEVADGVFILTIPQDLDGFKLLYAEIHVSAVASSGDIEVDLENLTTGGDVMNGNPITILEGDYHSKDSDIAFKTVQEFESVEWGDRISINVTAIGDDAEGLGINIVFTQP